MAVWGAPSGVVCPGDRAGTLAHGQRFIWKIPVYEQPLPMRNFLQGRIELVQALQASPLGAEQQDLVLILTATISACAACRWPGDGFDRKRFVESLIRFGAPSLHLDYISVGALLEMGLISVSETPWKGFPGQFRIFTGEEIDCSLADMAIRYPHLAKLNLKKASYASLIYRWLRCGYSHNYWAAGNTTHVAPSRIPAQISYITRRQPDGKHIRVASFHLDYLIEVAQNQVSTLEDNPLERPSAWWIEQP